MLLRVVPLMRDRFKRVFRLGFLRRLLCLAQLAWIFST
jgi:hypothetical protein